MASKQELVDRSFQRHSNTDWQCIHCGAHVKTSSAIRRCAHIAMVRGLGTAVCKNPRADIQEEVIVAAKHIIDEEKAAKQRKGASQLERQRDDAEKQPVMKQQKLSGSMSKAAAAEASAAWGECFFECNVAFRVADHWRYKKAVRLSIAAGPGYNPPGRRKVAGSLLTESFAKLDGKSVEAFEDVEMYGFTSGEDGWTDNNKVPITAQTVSGKIRTHLLDIKHVLKPTIKDHKYLLEGMEEARKKTEKLLVDNNVLKEELGKIVLEVQKLTDNAANCKKAREEYGELHPEVTVGHCTFHGINLGFNDFHKHPVMKMIEAQGRELTKYVRNHEKTMSAFVNALNTEISKEARTALSEEELEKLGSEKRLQLASDTRAAGIISMLRRILKAKHALRVAFIDPVVTTWGDAMKGDKKAAFRAMRALVNDDDFFDDLQIIDDTMANMFLLLRLADGDTPAMGKIYDRSAHCYAELGEAAVKINELHAIENWPVINRAHWTEDLQQYFRTCFRLRWDEWHNDLQAAGYCLDPEFWGHKQWENTEVMTGMRATCKKLLSSEKAALAMAQLMKFLRRESSFATAEAWEEAKRMPSVNWWLAWGAAVPELQSVTLKVLSQPISVGGVERVWSIFGWIQNKLRSKMLPATAKKLVMVHIWLKMETMKESGKWEADLLEHTDEDQTWEQLTSLDEDED
jgi:hypothetical protein